MPKNQDPQSPAGAPEPEFDRQAYLREVRVEILKNLGLPEDTRPEQVIHLLSIKQQMSRAPALDPTPRGGES